jgi:hypothetical protein
LSSTANAAPNPVTWLVVLVVSLLVVVGLRRWVRRIDAGS